MGSTSLIVRAGAAAAGFCAIASSAALAAASQPPMPDAAPAASSSDTASSNTAPSLEAHPDAAMDTAPRDRHSLEPDPLDLDAPPRMRSLGLMFDLGTLDGGMMSLVYRPTPWLRVHGGGGTNGAAPGLRMGAALSPFRPGFTVGLEGGHFFPGNVNGLFAAFAGANYDDSHLLEHFDYNFVNLQAGWEVERGDLMFFARIGVGYVWTKLPADGLDRIENLSSFVDPDGSIEAFVPSLKVGLIGFL